MERFEKSTIKLFYTQIDRVYESGYPHKPVIFESKTENSLSKTESSLSKSDVFIELP